MDNILSQEVFELTIEQQFQHRLMKEQISNLSQEELRQLLLEASRLLMLKDNVIRSLVQKVL
jgi:hypothetical protein